MRPTELPYSDTGLESLLHQTQLLCIFRQSLWSFSFILQDYYSIPFPTPTTPLTGRDGSLSSNPYSGRGTGQRAALALDFCMLKELLVWWSSAFPALLPPCFSRSSSMQKCFGPARCG